MSPDPGMMRAVEQLDYRVTAGDLAAHTGLDIKLAEQGLLVLASEAGGHLQVSETGEVAYLFPKNFRSVLQSKYFRLRLQQWWSKIWGVVFYLIRLSFGIVLIASIILMVLAIIVILIALSSSRGEGDNRDDRNFGGGGGSIFVPYYWFGSDWYWIFLPNYGDRTSKRYRSYSGEPEHRMNFLEAVFSFLFGDGNPNADLDERRWRAIATVIRNHGGAVVAEQIAPYLDNLGEGFSREYEDYMLPVLTRFNGRPEVSPEGQIVYYFPELQVSANEQKVAPVAAYLKELPWRFSQATSGQIIMAIGLGGVYLVAALTLGVMLRDGDVQQIVQEIDFVAFVASIYGILLAYGTGFLSIPLIRYFWIQGRNKKIEARNDQRLLHAETLNEAGDEIKQKIAYAQQFAAETVISADNLAYTTETDLTEQELAQADKIDEEWEKRLEGRSRPDALPD